ncbi:phenylalanine---tRNA ligase [Spizellomyces sp. 'palustris']|nr:phenylalanine---tRNA ligase [Spizellomyces sp. 'palustris']
MSYYRALSADIPPAASQTQPTTAGHIEILGRLHPTDSATNVSPTIVSKTPRRLHLQRNHPIHILKRRIESHFKNYAVMDSMDPVVTVHQNFDSLLFTPDHPGRAATDTYYVNANTVLRTHTSAHQSDVLKTRKADGYLLTADVYRRDEIDVSHYPVFHQMEGIRTFDRKKIEEEAKVDSGTRAIQGAILSESNPIQPSHTTREAQLVDLHLRHSLEAMVRDLFREEKDLQIRWIEAYFPFTSPSWEMEVFYRGNWLELLGCGVMQQEILDRSGNSDRIGWAFGLGLERIAMVMFDIPDIRLFWSTDDRFISQFSSGQIVKFQPFSKYPACYKDISFWCSETFHDNDFAEVVRDVAGDLAEKVELIDQFQHPKTKRTSRCFRINYRSMDRTFTNEEVDRIQDQVREVTKERLGVELR